MAFSFGASQAAMGGGKVHMGDELEEIQTQEFSFLSLNGDSKVRLCSPFPADALPPPTSSLLAIASTKSLMAAAGPEGLVVASTDSVRKAFSADAVGGSNVRPFQPELQIPLQGRVSHVAFSADEAALVIADQNGSGLAVYDVSGLLQNRSQPVGTISLNGEALRALSPNPCVPELFALITTKGELLMANVKNYQLESGPGGPVLRSGVSSLSWSTKGKQLVAGLADGTSIQMTPQGETKAELPRPPDLQGSQYVSSLLWLQNHSFLMTYTPSVVTPGDRPPSSYYILTRTPPDSYKFQELPEVCSPFGLERVPAFQYIARLKDFEPDVQEMLIVCSTASTDVGLFTLSSRPLSGDCPPEKSVNIFTSTTMSDDSRRAEMPMTEDMADSSPIGQALDLSSKTNVLSPIPGDDMKESATPLPAIMILNHEGVLSSWWVVYAESIRQQKPYHGLAAASKPAPISQQGPQLSAPVPETPKPAFGQGSMARPVFGQPSFGSPSAPKFGASTPLSASQQPTFGSPSVLGSSTPAFGQASQLGSNLSPFSQTPTQAPSQPSLGAGFGSFASAGGFGANLGSQATPQSIFAKAAAENPFANAGQPVFNTQPANPFPTTTDKFVLGSTFTPDSSAAMEEDKPEKPNSTLSFSSFGKSLDLSHAPQPLTQNKFEASPFSSPFGTVAETKAPLFQEPPSLTTPKQSTSANSVEPSTLSMAASPIPVSNLTQPPPSLPEDDGLSDSTIKRESPTDQTPNLPEPPLPPEPTSRADYGPGDTSASSSNNSGTSIEDAPLPPDFLPPKQTEPPKKTERPSEPETPRKETTPTQLDLPGSPEHIPPALPDESEGGNDGFEDSGEDIAEEISPIDSKISPESSFGAISDKSPLGGRFTRISAPEPKPAIPKPLFGEITEKPIFPAPQLPKARPMLSPKSPRSPSPVRPSFPGSLFSPETPRASSAPIPGDVLSRRKTALESSKIANQAILPADDSAEEFSIQELQRQAQKTEAETQELVEDEDDQLRADLARPISPAPTLDPFLPHQDYTGESEKPGVPGQIERLYRDINAMIGTMGINSRSLSSFLLYQKTHTYENNTAWLRTLRSENFADVLNEKLLLSDMEKLQQGVEVLNQSLEEGKAGSIQEKLEKCSQLFSKDLQQLRGQCAGMRQTLDLYTDAVAVASGPLSAEQSALQQDLRKLSTDFQTKIAELEREVSLLRAKIADSPQPTDGSKRSRKHSGRPTVEAVTSTINTMTNMAQQKSGDIDVLEAQMRKLGIDTTASVGTQSREASPFSTPIKNLLKPLATPGSRTSLEGGVHSSYHTPESNRTSRFRSSVLSQSVSRTPSRPTQLVVPEDSERWKVKFQRRKEAVGHLKTALGNRKAKVRTLDDF